MMTPMTKTLAVALSLALMTAACADPTAPAAPTPAAPTISETFTGIVTVFGSDTQQFTVKEVGGVKVTLVSVDSPAALKVGIGTFSFGQCLVLGDATAVGGTATIISGTATQPGTFCVSLSDPGNLVETVSYTITVLHS